MMCGAVADMSVSAITVPVDIGFTVPVEVTRSLRIAGTTSEVALRDLPSGSVCEPIFFHRVNPSGY